MLASVLFAYLGNFLTLPCLQALSATSVDRKLEPQKALPKKRSNYHLQVLTKFFFAFCI